MGSAKRQLNGILVLDKPSGISANQALQRVKRVLRAAKAGHAGTLDPLATGVLPICLGEATKVSRFLLGADKQYRFTARLGVTTSSADADGEVQERRAVPELTESGVNAVLQRFAGRQTQVPPMHSAIKMNGTPLYKLARRGVEVERTPRQISIHDIQLLALRTKCDELDIEVACSKGTYVRTLAADIGDALGCGAHVTALRRVRAGDLGECDAVSMEQVSAAADDSDRLAGLLLPMDRAVGRIPKLPLALGKADLMRQGQRIRALEPGLAGFIALYCNDRFIGVGEAMGDGTVAPRRLLRFG